MGYIGVCGFSHFGRKWGSDVGHFGFKQGMVSSLHSCLWVGMLFRRSYLFIIIDKTTNKCPSQNL